MLAVLGFVAVKAQGLVGGELPDAGVDGSSNGNTSDCVSRDLDVGGRVGFHWFRSPGIREEHTPLQDLVKP